MEQANAQTDFFSNALVSSAYQYTLARRPRDWAALR
jgi:hypothetical protein